MNGKEDVDNFQKAIEAVKNGMPTLQASKLFAIPRTTLRRRINNLQNEVKPVGAPTILTVDQEAILCKWIFHLAKIGFPVTKMQLLNSVEMMVKELKIDNNFKDGRPGRHWFESFMKRHPDISKKVSQSLTRSRAKITEEGIRAWFKQVLQHLEDNDNLEVVKDPSRVFNLDETGFFITPKDQNVLAKKGETVVSLVGNSEKECITSLITVGANGSILPPMIMFKYKRIPMSVSAKIPKGWAIGRSDSGWMTGESFFEYIVNVFYPWLKENNIKFPIILFLDGHCSHLTLNLSEFCREKKIILTALPANATHIMQPLDVAVFKPLKSLWQDAVKNWRLQNHAEILKKEDFGILLQTIMANQNIKKNIISGFKVTGLFPFDANAVSYNKFFSKALDTNMVTSTPITHLTTASAINIKENLLFLEHEIGESKLEKFKLELENSEWTDLNTTLQSETNIRSDSSQSNVTEIENNVDKTSVSSLPESSSTTDETDKENMILIPRIAESKDTLIAIENNDLLLRKEKRNSNEESNLKPKLINEEIMDIIDFDKDFEIEGELRDLPGTNNVNSIIIKRKIDCVENNENKISNSQNFLPFKKRYIPPVSLKPKKITRKKKVTISKSSNRGATNKISRPIFEVPHSSQSSLMNMMDRAIEIEILSQAQVNEISSTQVSPPHHNIQKLQDEEQEPVQSGSKSDIEPEPETDSESEIEPEREQIPAIPPIHQPTPEPPERTSSTDLEQLQQQQPQLPAESDVEPEQPSVGSKPREMEQPGMTPKYDNLTVDLYYDPAFTDIELLAENIVKKQLTEDLSKARKRKQNNQHRKQDKKINEFASTTASSCSSSSISSASSYKNIPGTSNIRNKNNRKKNLKTDINNVQGEKFFRAQAGINENTNDEFRTRLAETIENESNTSKKLFRAFMETKKEGISKANETVNKINEENEIEEVNLLEIHWLEYALRRKKDKISKEENNNIMDPEISSSGLVDENIEKNNIETQSSHHTSLDSEQIENILEISSASEDLFADFESDDEKENERTTTFKTPIKNVRVLISPNSGNIFPNVQNKETNSKYSKNCEVQIKKNFRKILKESEGENVTKRKPINKKIIESETKNNKTEERNRNRVEQIKIENKKDIKLGIEKQTVNDSKQSVPRSEITLTETPRTKRPTRNSTKLIKEYETIDLTTSSKKENKFFHHTDRSESKVKEPVKSIDNKNYGLRTRNLSLTKSKAKVNTKESSSIFDFSASQSSPSNSDDPTKEVIRDLIKAGKVEVVKYKKGSGKLKTKFQNRKPRKKLTKIEQKKIIELAPTVHEEINLDINDNFDDNHDNFDTISNHSEASVNTNTFSNLARHAINNRVAQSPYSQLISNPKKIKDKQVLLALAKSFVRRSEAMKKTKQDSINKNKKLNQPSKTPQQLGSASPWRVQEDLPTVFNFSRNSDNLPSFSSDLINPPSPKRKQPKNLGFKPKKSVSFNDSNIENMQPSFEKSKLIIETNPKKGKPYRAPLKQINIIDVINLPILKYNNSTPIHKPAVFNPFPSSIKPSTVNQKALLFNVSTQEKSDFQNNESEISNLFGFDQDIEQENQISEEDGTTKINLSKQILHNKLKKLKRLVPHKKTKRETNEIPRPTRLSVNKIKTLFKEPFETEKQQDIREMLCSTMKEQKTPHGKKDHGINDLFDNDDIFEDIEMQTNENQGKVGEIAELFADDSLTKNSSIRTYERPKRKPPKVKHNFIMFDSDSEEENYAEKLKKKKKYLRQHKADDKHDKELESFLSDFNSMCAEVDNYNLVIE